jgi:hypothetical protein
MPQTPLDNTQTSLALTQAFVEDRLPVALHVPCLHSPRGRLRYADWLRRPRWRRGQR